MTINKELPPKSDVDCLYMCRKKGRGRLIGLVVSVVNEKNSLKWYVKHQSNPLIVAFKKISIIASMRWIHKNGQQRLNNWKKKQMHDQYMREINETNTPNSWKCLSIGDLIGCT